MFEVGRALSSTWQALHGARPQPLHAKPSHEHHEAKRPRSTLRRGAVLCVLSLGASLLWGALHDAEIRSFARAVMPDREVLAKTMGFGIDQVSLAGHRYTYDADIFAALDLENVRSFMEFDAKAAKARLERLPWIATAELTRVYPGRLDVLVTERKPYALWTRGSTQYLIDDTGRVLSAVTGGTVPDLPRVAGEGAAAGAKALFDLIGAFPAIATRLAEAERVGDRRWDLKLKDGVTLRLPVDGEATVLDEIARDEGLLKLASGTNVTIDFRGPGRAAVRPVTSTPTPAAASPGPGS